VIFEETVDENSVNNTLMHFKPQLVEIAVCTYIAQTDPLPYKLTPRIEEVASVHTELFHIWIQKVVSCQNAKA
jgi:hypothetical protein